MYKLTIVAGPNRGSSFPVQQGETTIGRQIGNQIVLPSGKVSKRHCVLSVSQDGVIVKDQGSSNGTFINGVLTKQRMIKPGDRLSIGEFVLELSTPQTKSEKLAPAIAGLGNVIQFPGSESPNASPIGALSTNIGSSTGVIGQPMPSDLKGKVLWYFERHIMPIFYGLSLKQEWKTITIALFSGFILANLIISVFPLMKSNRTTVVKETGKRAAFMAKQIAERNSAALAVNAETKTDIGSVDREEGVRVAVLTDLDNRIIAPGTKMGQYLTTSGEGNLAVKARQLFQKGRETTIVAEVDSSTVVAIEPVKVLSTQAGKNVVIAMAIVSIDTALATPDLGEIGVVYGETLILTGLLAAFILFVLYRLTLKPFEVLNDDIDKVLKGDMNQVTHEFKMEEFDQLWDVINSALQRIPKGGMGGDLQAGQPVINIDDFLNPLKMFGETSKVGIVACDKERNVVYLNSVFEEMSGIRFDNSVGQDLHSAARDQSFGPFTSDLFDKAASGSVASDDYDFSGVSYKVHASIFGSPGDPKCYVLMAVKAEG